MNAEECVALMSASEFGRTLNTNGDETDNGWGSHHFTDDQYGNTLAQWFGVSDGQLGDIFPNLANFGSDRNLGFMG